MSKVATWMRRFADTFRPITLTLILTEIAKGPLVREKIERMGYLCRADWKNQTLSIGYEQDWIGGGLGEPGAFREQVSIYHLDRLKFMLIEFYDEELVRAVVGMKKVSLDPTDQRRAKELLLLVRELRDKE